MPTTSLDGPQIVYGPLAAIPSTYGAGGSQDPNSDAGPNGVYQGVAMLDPRFVFPKDNVTGVRASVMAHLPASYMKSVEQIPAALATNNIAAAQNVTANTAMTLASASTGVTLNIPLHPVSPITVLNSSAVVTPAICLDFGFCFGNVTSGSTTITVSDSTMFFPGMPLVIGGVGNTGGTVPLLTLVTALASATTITVLDTPAATNATAPIGMGDLWGPTVQTPTYPSPAAHTPFISRGPLRVLDPRQAISRGVQIVGTGAGCSGGNFSVASYDIYGQAQTETITVAAGASTGWGKKAVKWIVSVTPLFSDAQNYTVGTSDVFGIHYRSRVWENTRVFWNGAAQTSSTGWLTADVTSPATATTGDVRGTIQTSASGGGSGIGVNASNGTISSLMMSGRRLDIGQFVPPQDILMPTPWDYTFLFGVTPA